MAQLDDCALCKLYKKFHPRKVKKKNRENEDEENEDIENEEDPGCNQMESLDQEQDTTPLPHEKAPQHVNSHCWW